MKELDLIRDELFLESKDHAKKYAEYLLNYADGKISSDPHEALNNIYDYSYGMYEKFEGLKDDLHNVERVDSLTTICENKRKRRERDYIKKKLNEVNSKLDRSIEGDEWIDELIETIKDEEINSPIEQYFDNKETAEEAAAKLYGDMASE